MYFADILMIERASIQQNLLGNHVAVCIGFFLKSEIFASTCPPAHPPFFYGKTDMNQTINWLQSNLIS